MECVSLHVFMCRYSNGGNVLNLDIVNVHGLLLGNNMDDCMGVNVHGLLLGNSMDDCMHMLHVCLLV